MRTIFLLSMCLAFASLVACNGSNPKSVDSGTQPNDAGVDASDASLDASDGSLDASDANVDGATDAGDSCRGDAGCWQCAPTVDENFLNHCTTSACAPFDNAARIPGFSK